METTHLRDYSKWKMSDIRFKSAIRNSDGNGNEFLDGFEEYTKPGAILEIRDTSTMVTYLPDEITELMIITWLDEEGNPIKANNGTNENLQTIIGNYQYSLYVHHSSNNKKEFLTDNLQYAVEAGSYKKDQLFLSMMPSSTSVMTAILTPQ